ncbi:unnamed protein product [Nippostrongylus brasiliensis]|uniref:Recep_L_domain domain-containing protein n=1 Tax=Nippostrongylus brasiliensis TaxID=27835 RepID=A0A0N4YVX6_NIPBR|nr:unnamed protein product [Nippostrongylus brasiliensis]
MARDGEECFALVGEFKLNDSFELSSVWPNIRKVYGTITIVNTALTDLNALKNVRIIDGWSLKAEDLAPLTREVSELPPKILVETYTVR